jgi:mRNA interferase MazF
LTTEFRGSRYEVQMPRVPWLKLQSYANAQAMGSAEYHELNVLRGRFDKTVMAKIRDAIRWTLDL